MEDYEDEPYNPTPTLPAFLVLLAMLVALVGLATAGYRLLVK